MRSAAISEPDSHKAVQSLRLITVRTLIIKKKKKYLYYYIDFQSKLEILGCHRLKGDVSHFSAEVSHCKRYMMKKEKGKKMFQHET